MASSEHIFATQIHEGAVAATQRQPLVHNLYGLIFFNLLILCMSYENSSNDYILFLKINNKIVTILFTVEFLLKLIAYGFKSFFYVSWNIFDFVLVLISYIDWKFSDVEGIDIRVTGVTTTTAVSNASSSLTEYSVKSIKSISCFKIN